MNQGDATAAINITHIAISVIQLILTVLLLVSIYQRRPALATPWLGFTMFSLVVLMILFIVMIVILANAIPSVEPPYRDSVTVQVAVMGVMFPISIGLGLYFWFVVYSFWHEMKNAEGTQRNPLELRPKV